MSRMKEAFQTAIERAFPDMTTEQLDAFADRFFRDEASDAEQAAVDREFWMMSHGAAARILADIEGNTRECCDCGDVFAGPGPRCGACVEIRDNKLERMKSCQR